MKFFANVKDVIFKFLNKIKCSCFNTIDSHDIVTFGSCELNDELTSIRHDIKSTLHLINFIVEKISNEDEKKGHLAKIHKTVKLINDKINVSYLKDIKKI